ncbi:hypothetical protein E2C01_080853 [Portunus trituberculatus]|uniref:Uncharacterized protein n=1 Tax=Portunus trituberculatus TaxID=210409 RepID=A0A5B7IKQ3_PORTR|nr:hypothetical protein [Portunus trituberculatus]
MEEVSEPGSAGYFSRGSVDPASGTTAAAAVTGDTQLSYVGIRGNYVADGTVKRAAAGPAIARHVPPSREESHGPMHPAGTPGARRQQEAGGLAGTPPPPAITPLTPPREDGVLLQRIWVGHPTWEQLSEGFVRQKLAHCGGHNRLPLAHYLLSCPATARLTSG